MGSVVFGVAIGSDPSVGCGTDFFFSPKSFLRCLSSLSFASLSSKYKEDREGGGGEFEKTIKIKK